MSDYGSSCWWLAFQGTCSRSFQRDGETRPDMLVASDLEVTVETEADMLAWTVGAGVMTG